MITKIKKLLHPVLVKTLRLTSSEPLKISAVQAPYSYEDAKLALLSGDDLLFNRDGSENKNKRQSISALLDNVNDAIDSGNVFTLPEQDTSSFQKDVMLPIVRRVMADTIAWELVGVQAMTGPVSRIHTLRVKNINTASDSVSPSSETKPQLSIQILAEVVEAKTRRLSARINLYDRVDSPEYIKTISDKIATEFDSELIRTLAEIASPNTLEFNIDNVSFAEDESGNLYTLEQISGATIAVMINRICNLIAAKTRRGAGNWVVVSPLVYKWLCSSPLASFTKTTSEYANAGMVHFVGLLNNVIRVYVNTLADDTAPVLIGYKGLGEIDSGFMYCPYVPVCSSGSFFDPMSGDPVQSLMTRYGTYEIVSSNNSSIIASDYYGLVKIVNNQTATKNPEPTIDNNAELETAKLYTGDSDTPKKSRKKNADVNTVALTDVDFVCAVDVPSVSDEIQGDPMPMDIRPVRKFRKSKK